MNESPHLFSPLTIRELSLANRIFVSPMCQYSSVDGFATDWHLVHLGSRAVGGASLVIVEATAVSPEGRITPGDLGLYADAHVERLLQITSFMRSQGAAAGIQLAHAGRKASMAVPWEEERLLAPSEGGWHTIWGPSALAFAENYGTPEVLTVEGIAGVKDDFVAAAQRALLAGFNCIEIHSAHGYLLHSFLSPLSNVRTDQYGGSFENRIRLLVETVDAVRAVIPSGMPLFVRISATDWADGGWTVDESVELSKVLKQHGVDFIDVSSGGLVPYARIPVGPGYQTSFAQKIRKEAEILTGSVGIIVDAAQADHIIRSGQADAVLIARELLREPYWPLQAARHLHKPASWPAQYLRAAPAGTSPRVAF